MPGNGPCNRKTPVSARRAALTPRTGPARSGVEVGAHGFAQQLNARQRAYRARARVYARHAQVFGATGGPQCRRACRPSGTSDNHG